MLPSLPNPQCPITEVDRWRVWSNVTSLEYLYVWPSFCLPCWPSSGVCDYISPNLQSWGRQGQKKEGDRFQAKRFCNCRWPGSLEMAISNETLGCDCYIMCTYVDTGSLQIKLTNRRSFLRDVTNKSPPDDEAMKVRSKLSQHINRSCIGIYLQISKYFHGFTSAFL